jgi:mRNA-degrading endonuclease toxin of MazEF toxin-antitoxin module
VDLPAPEPGTVIHYAYLWADERQQGREEGTKDRPCVIVIASQRVEDRIMVTVVPVTRSPQGPDAVEIPPKIKARLGLEPGEPSWVVCSEYNKLARSQQ